MYTPPLLSLVRFVASEDVKQNVYTSTRSSGAVCESGGGRPGLPVPKTVRTVSVDVKQH